jgi:Leu/Phe-tRNA-protein transferase
MTEHNQYTYDFDKQLERVLKSCNAKQRKPKKNKKVKKKYVNIEKSYFYSDSEIYENEEE